MNEYREKDDANSIGIFWPTLFGVGWFVFVLLGIHFLAKWGDFG